MSETPPPDPTPTGAKNKPRLAAQMQDKNVLLPDAIDLAWYKIQEVEAHVLMKMEGATLLEVDQVKIKLFEAGNWCQRLNRLLQQLDRPDIVVPKPGEIQL